MGLIEWKFGGIGQKDSKKECRGEQGAGPEISSSPIVVEGDRASDDENALDGEEKGQEWLHVIVAAGHRVIPDHQVKLGVRVEEGENLGIKN